MNDKSDWKWFGHAGHLLVSRWCAFHLCTQVGGFLVSTVGEYWPDRTVREIHAKVYDAEWLAQNIHLKGDDFDAAYMEKFGYETIGYNREYETMVFKLGGKVCESAECECGCGLPEPENWVELDVSGYNNPKAATEGHYAMCEKWANVPAGKDAA